MNIIQTEQLSKKYQFYRKEPGLKGTLKSLVYRKKHYAEAVKNISLEIKEGELVGFLGPNGAGKTTFLKMLSGILYPSSGVVTVLGYNPQKRNKNFKRQFGIVMGQKDQLVKTLPAMDNFLLFKEFYDISDKQFKENVDELVGLLNISHILDIQVRKLSLGERMKCELVASLLHNPKVLFLDEPAIGLDVLAQKNIRDFIKKYNEKRKTTIILTSHYMEDIKELCDRVIIINHGTVIYDGKLNKLISQYAKDKIIKITTLKEVKREDFQVFGTVEEYNGISVSVRVPREHVKVVAAKIISSSLPIDDILIDEMSITEIIRAIFDEK